MLKILTICAVMVTHYCAFSQYQANNWAFGDSAGLNFSTSPPEHFYSSMLSFECCASISDSSGTLLFYTNGEKVWNKEHNVMPNGSGLDVGGGSSSSYTQGVLIIPHPGLESSYYIVYAEANMKYSLIDIDLDDGLGDVSAKNLVFDSTNIFTQKMQVVQHANGRDWWLLLLAWPEGGDDGYGNPFTFVEYLFTPIGIEGPFYQDGVIYGAGDGVVSVGQMKVSKDGTRIANTRGKHVDIYNFDRCTGGIEVFYSILNVGTKDLYALELSPDGNKLNLADWFYLFPNLNFIHSSLISEKEISATKRLF